MRHTVDELQARVWRLLLVAEEADDAVDVNGQQRPGGRLYQR
jgi:hypothetical protein